jgi:hypothetical protein
LKFGPGLARAAERLEELSLENVLQWVNNYRLEAEHGIELAKRKGDLQALRGLVKEARECAIRLGQTLGEWAPKSANVTIDARRQQVNVFDGKDLDELRALRQSLTAIGIEDKAS